jgi:hypothetical protein
LPGERCSVEDPWNVDGCAPYALATPHLTSEGAPARRRQHGLNEWQGVVLFVLEVIAQCSQELLRNVDEAGRPLVHRVIDRGEERFARLRTR